MADPVVELEPVVAVVEPGGQTRVVVTVVNESSIVEGYRVEVLDDVGGHGRDVSGPASWSEVLPAEGTTSADGGGADLTVYPGQQGVVVVVLSPPTGTRVPGGRCPFAVRVSSVVDPGASTVVEGDLEVGKVSALQAKLVPVTSTGRWSGRHTVELSNWGNTPARLRVVAEDPDRALGFLIDPDLVELPVGASAPVRLKVRTRNPQLRGTPARLPFTVRAEPADVVPGQQPPLLAPGVPGVPSPETATVDGAFNQKPILTTGVVLGAGLALACVAGLAAYGLMQRGEAAPTFQELGVPDTPQVTVDAAGPASVRVSWVPIEQVEGYKLLQLDNQGAVSGETLLAPELGATVVDGLEPEQEYCFTVAAVRGEVQSPQSQPECATTEQEAVAPTTPEPTTDDPGETTAEDPSAETPTDPGEGGATQEPTDAPTEGGETGTTPPLPAPVPPTDGPSETPTVEPPPFAPGEWAAVLGVFVVEGLAETQAHELASALIAEEVEAVAVSTDDFPDLGVTRPGWLVLSEGYATSAEALSACQELNAELPDLVQFCNPPVQPISP